MFFLVVGPFPFKKLNQPLKVSNFKKPVRLELNQCIRKR